MHDGSRPSIRTPRIAANVAGIVDGAGLDMLEEESVMRKGADKIFSDQIIERLHNAASQEEAGPRTREGNYGGSTRSFAMSNCSRNRMPSSRRGVAFNSMEAVERMLMMAVENIRLTNCRSATSARTPRRTRKLKSKRSDSRTRPKPVTYPKTLLDCALSSAHDCQLRRPVASSYILRFREIAKL